MFGIGEALSIGGSLLGGLGGGKSKTSQVSIFDSMPGPLKDAYLKNYLPKVNDYLNMPYQAIPMARANEPQSIFDSPELYRLQQFSDAQGGYFSPYTDPNAQGGEDPAAAQAAQQQQMEELRNEMIARQGGGRSLMDSRMTTKDQWNNPLSRLNLVASQSMGNMQQRGTQYTPEQLAKIGAFMGGTDQAGANVRLAELQGMIPRTSITEDYLMAIMGGAPQAQSGSFNSYGQRVQDQGLGMRGNYKG